VRLRASGSEVDADGIAGARGGLSGGRNAASPQAGSGQLSAFDFLDPNQADSGPPRTGL